jgi:antitoxin ChpS
MVFMTKLRNVGSSMLNLGAGSVVGISVDGGRLIVDPQPRRRYTLDALLAASDSSKPQPPEEREWVDAPAAGARSLAARNATPRTRPKNFRMKRHPHVDRFS